MKRTIAAASAVGLAALLAACSNAEPSETPVPEEASPTQEASEPEPEEGVVTDEDGVVTAIEGAYGQPETWPTGLEVTVAEPEEIDVSDFGLDGLPEGVKVTVTLKNVGEATVDTSMVGIYVRSGSGDGEPVICEEDNSGSVPERMRVGDEATWFECFAVEDAADVTTTVQGDDTVPELDILPQ